MASWDSGDLPTSPEPRQFETQTDSAAYQDGYDSTERELAVARALGWEPTQRQLTLALLRATRLYGRVRRGKVVGGRQPEWLHGRADALRALLRQGMGALDQ